MHHIEFRVAILLAMVLASAVVLPSTSVSYGGVWTYVKGDGVDFYPGQPFFYEGRLVVPFADATDKYLGLLFFDPGDLRLLDYKVLKTSWYPKLFKSFLYKDTVFLVDYAGGLVAYNFTSNKWKVFMLTNSSRRLMVFSDAYMDDEGYLYLVGWGGRYYAYSTITKLKWNGTGFEKIWDAEVNTWNLPGNILVHGDKVYFTTIRGVYAFDKGTGKLVAEKKYVVKEPFKPNNMTLWWSNGRVHLLVNLHNNTTFDTDYDAVVHLELDPDTLALIKAGRLYYVDGSPAHYCYFMYTEYPFIAGGDARGCRDSARIIDVGKWLVAYFPTRYWLMGTEGIILHTYYATLTVQGENLYVAVKVRGIQSSYDLMVFKAPANLLEVDNNTLFGDLVRVYQLVEKPTTIIQLGEENLGGRNPGYAVVQYVEPKYYNTTTIEITQHHTLNPYKETTTTTTSPSNTVTQTTQTTQTTAQTTTTTASPPTKTTATTTATTTVTSTRTTPTKTNTTQTATQVTSRTTVTSKTTTPASTTTPTSSQQPASPTTTSSQQTSILGDTALYIAVVAGIIISIGVILAFIKKK